MDAKDKARQALSNIKAAFTNDRLFKTKIISVVVLVFMLAVNVLPVKAIPISLDVNPGQSLQTITTSFVAVADAYVNSGSPDTNYG